MALPRAFGAFLFDGLDGDDCEPFVVLPGLAPNEDALPPRDGFRMQLERHHLQRPHELAVPGQKVDIVHHRFVALRSASCHEEWIGHDGVRRLKDDAITYPTLSIEHGDFVLWEISVERL